MVGFHGRFSPSEFPRGLSFSGNKVEDGLKHKNDRVSSPVLEESAANQASSPSCCPRARAVRMPSSALRTRTRPPAPEARATACGRCGNSSLSVKKIALSSYWVRSFFQRTIFQNGRGFQEHRITRSFRKGMVKRLPKT